MFRLSRMLSHLSNDGKNAWRTLYTARSMDIDDYINNREKFKKSYSYHGNLFRQRMKIIVTSGMMILSEDLKYMLHLADRNEEDVQLSEGMMRNFYNQHKSTQGFKPYDFGTVVMRYFYHIERPDNALRLFQDPELEGFFNQPKACQILCDMLYKRARYQDVIDVFDAIRSRLIPTGGTVSERVLKLAFAACYKLNTPDSSKYCSDQFRQLRDAGHILPRRTIAFAAALAVKQDDPCAALEIIGTLRNRNDAIVRHIEVESYAKLGRVNDALTALREVLEDTPTKETITRDSMNVLREVIGKTADNRLMRDYNMLEKFLHKNGYVSDKTLEDILTSPIDLGHKDGNYRERPSSGSSNNSKDRCRRGLSDLE